MRKELATAICLLGATTAQSHTVVMHTEEMALQRSAAVDLSLVFTHATSGGPTMPMEIQSFELHSGSRYTMGSVDLTNTLTPVEWLDYVDSDGVEHRAAAYTAQIPRDEIRSLGDYQLALVTEPYWDDRDGMYIQQFVKLMLNVGGAQTNWFSTLDMPAEIHALKKPYANYVGEVFSGVVYADGLPVPFARLEIDYLNYEPVPGELRFADTPRIEAPHPSYEYISIMANQHGEFHFGIPHAGWWAIAALTVGPEFEYEGEFLSQDAILWIHAEDVRPVPRDE